MANKKIKKLDISWSGGLTETGFRYLGEFLCKERVKILKWNGSLMNIKKLEALCNELPEKIPGEKVTSRKVLLEKIDISFNSELRPGDYNILGQSVEICGVKKLSMAGCEVNGECLRLLKPYLNVIKLCVADNPSIGGGIVNIAKIVNKNNLDQLDMSDFVAAELEQFRKKLKKKKLKQLWLGDENNVLSKAYISEVCEILPFIKERLHIKSRVLHENCFDLLSKKHTKLQKSEPKTRNLPEVFIHTDDGLHTI